MSPQQQQNVEQIFSDLEDIHSQSQVTDEQKEQLRSDLMTLAEGTVKPSAESVAALSADLQSAWSDQTLTKVEKAQLANDITIVLNSANIPPEELQQVIVDVHGVLAASNVSPEDAQAIAADLHAIALELNANAASAWGQIQSRLGELPGAPKVRPAPGALRDALRQRRDR